VLSLGSPADALGCDRTICRSLAEDGTDGLVTYLAVHLAGWNHAGDGRELGPSRLAMSYGRLPGAS
jgi:hypothetical protein